MKEYFLELFSERSTWVGLTGFLSALGVAFEPEQAEAFVAAGVAVVSAIYALTVDPKVRIERVEPEGDDDDHRF